MAGSLARLLALGARLALAPATTPADPSAGASIDPAQLESRTMACGTQRIESTWRASADLDRGLAPLTGIFPWVKRFEELQTQTEQWKFRPPKGRDMPLSNEVGEYIWNMKAFAGWVARRPPRLHYRPIRQRMQRGKFWSEAMFGRSVWSS